MCWAAVKKIDKSKRGERIKDDQKRMSDERWGERGRPAPLTHAHTLPHTQQWYRAGWTHRRRTKKLTCSGRPFCAHRRLQRVQLVPVQCACPSGGLLCRYDVITRCWFLLVLQCCWALLVLLPQFFLFAQLVLLPFLPASFCSPNPFSRMRMSSACLLPISAYLVRPFLYCRCRALTTIPNRRDCRRALASSRCGGRLSTCSRSLYSIFVSRDALFCSSIPSFGNSR